MNITDELRQMADGQATYRDARVVMLQAADTIWQLRDDLQCANAAVQDAEHDESMAWDRVRKAEAENAELRMRITSLDAALEGMHLIREQDMAENAKLRELCADMYRDFANADYQLKSNCGKTFIAVTRYKPRLQELGIEVDG